MYIQVVAGEFGEREYGQLVPGSRVEYRGVLWKVVGMYFASCPRSPEDGRAAAASTGKRARYLILQSLDLTLENLPSLGAMRLP